jgi:hypothetical protein
MKKILTRKSTGGHQAKKKGRKEEKTKNLSPRNREAN